ncbi:MAG: hypothetical protein ACRDZ4_01410 [Egibacteraceae bacterium]
MRLSPISLAEPQQRDPRVQLQRSRAPRLSDDRVVGIIAGRLGWVGLREGWIVDLPEGLPTPVR